MNKTDYEKWHASDEYRRKLRPLIRTRDNAHVVSERAQELFEKWMLNSERSEEKAERLASVMRLLMQDLREFAKEWKIEL